MLDLRLSMSETCPIPALLAFLRKACTRAAPARRRLAGDVEVPPGRLRRLLAGEEPLPLSLLFGLLAAAATPPAVFFGELYGFSALLPAVRGPAGVGRHKAARGPGGRPPAPVDRRPGERPTVGGPPPPAGPGPGERPSEATFVAVAGSLVARVRLKLALAGLAEERVERWLALPAGHLARAGGGRAEATVEELFALLAVLGEEPAAFFAEYYGVRGRLAALAEREVEPPVGLFAAGPEAWDDPGAGWTGVAGADTAVPRALAPAAGAALPRGRRRRWVREAAPGRSDEAAAPGGGAGGGVDAGGADPAARVESCEGSARWAEGGRGGG
jgi:hypothetical protein